MGRGRQKAKQTKAARALQYYSPETNYHALEQEPRAPTGGTAVVTDDPCATGGGPEYDSQYPTWHDENR